MLRRILIVAAAVIVAGLGLFLGSLTKNMVTGPDTIPLPPTTGLTEGALFPDVPVIDESGAPHTTGELLGGQGGVVIFMALGCSPCKEMSRQWQGYFAGGRLEGIQLFGITDSRPELVRLYKQNNGIDFPIYADTAMVFTKQYHVTDFPLKLVVSRSDTIQHHTYDPSEPVEMEEVRRLLER